eukprot:TRINITY_DN53544_c0_g1_i1.p1 TRINITY_DN53544_c0_g1~~TRINITY_DN53544_c0_g1_i1.p1  ORF type:complete len:468 (+),score=88.81 TRINITY_DN53544_c0_g1_i1:43-1404(+)
MAISAPASRLESKSPHESFNEVFSGSSFSFTMLSPDKRTAKPFKMPRDGPSVGGGTMHLFDKKVLEDNRVHLCDDSPREKARKRKVKTTRPNTVPDRSRAGSTLASIKAARRHLQSAGETSSASLGLGDTSPGRSNASGVLDARARARLSPEERRAAEIAAKWKKTEDDRSLDSTIIRDKVERRKDERDARTKRLIESVTGRGLAFDTAMELHQADADRERKAYEHYLEWDDNVFKPAATKAFDHMNLDRATQQWIRGRKSVGFDLDPFKLHVNVSKDPSRKHLLQDAQEKAFHEETEALLGRSRSAPALVGHHVQTLHDRSGMKDCMRRALSRPVLEPNNWNQVASSVFGKFNQACEMGSEGRRMQRGGPNVHLHDESDGVAVAGTRKSKRHGHGDMGILREESHRGESNDFKTGFGASSGAPAQDHFTFERGTAITDLEFPLGKKAFPGAR